MTKVGIRQLKANLSAYVAAASRGDLIVITDHGTVVAQLSPLESDGRIQRLIDEGLALPPAVAKRSIVSPMDIGAPISDLLSVDDA